MLPLSTDDGDDDDSLLSLLLFLPSSMDYETDGGRRRIASSRSGAVVVVVLACMQDVKIWLRSVSFRVWKTVGTKSSERIVVPPFCLVVADSHAKLWESISPLVEQLQ